MTDAYLAGFFDGEGHIGIAKNGSLLIDVTNTERAPLDLFVARFGGRVRGPRPRPANVNGKPTYVWRLVSREAEACLRALAPFLLVKRFRAERAFASRALFTGANRIHFGANGHVITDAERAHAASVLLERRRFYEEFRRLNSRGLPDWRNLPMPEPGSQEVA